MELAGTYPYNEQFAEQILLALNNAYSDKGSFHQYHKVYAHLFETINITSFLEIGLFLNDLPHTDLYAWAEIFPLAKIYGGDIKREQLFNQGNIETSYFDQNDQSSIDAFKAQFPIEFDVILDDASHFYGSTIKTFESLFPVVKTGGLYLIEDCAMQANGWQNTVGQLEEYFLTHGYEYKIYESRTPDKQFDPETNEPTDIDNPGDDYIFCIYKR